MLATQMRQEVVDLLDRIPESKVASVYDFVQFLAERAEKPGWAAAQESSAAYAEWVSDDNDVYDEVFADVAPTR